MQQVFADPEVELICLENLNVWN